MNMLVRIAIGLFIAASAADTVTAAAQQSRAPAAAAKKVKAQGVLTVPAAGTFAGGGQFTGTISINRFERRGNDIIAIGMVSGVLSRGSLTLGTAVAGEVAWPVRVGTGGLSLVNRPGSAPGRLTRVAWTPDMPGDARLLRVQAENCPVLNIDLGPITVDLLGALVALSPVSLDLAGVVGTPLGDLVCAASDLLGNVAAIVNLLNSILGLVTGLLGGLTGGIGGIIPMP
jgi:hypothetical protein